MDRFKRCLESGLKWVLKGFGNRLEIGKISPSPSSPRSPRRSKAFPCSSPGRGALLWPRSRGSSRPLAKKGKELHCSGLTSYILHLFVAESSMRQLPSLASPMEKPLPTFIRHDLLNSSSLISMCLEMILISLGLTQTRPDILQQLPHCWHSNWRPPQYQAPYLPFCSPGMSLFPWLRCYLNP